MFAVPVRATCAVAAFAFAGLAHAVDNPTVDLTVNPSMVAPGGTVTITGTVTNTSKKPTTYTATYTISGGCSYSDSYEYTFKLGSAQTRTASVNYTAPSCPGTYTVYVQVTSPSSVVARTASFTVQ